MQNLRLIIAEDDVETREILKQYLLNLPDIKVVGEASTGKELIEEVSILEPDLLLVDIDMPEMDGLTAVKKVLEILPNLKVIFITGHEEFAIDCFLQDKIPCFCKVFLQLSNREFFIQHNSLRNA